MELQPVDFSLRAKYQRNVVAAVVSTDTRWIGWKALPLLRIRYGSEDDSRRPPKGRYQAGKPHANALSRLRRGYGEPGDNAFHLDYFA